MPVLNFKILMTLVLAAAASSYSNSLADDSQSQRNHHRRNHHRHGIRNLHEVHPWLFRGGEPSEDAFKTLFEMGVSTVVDLKSTPSRKEGPICKHLGMNYVNIPLSHRTKPTKTQITQFLKIVDYARQHTGKGSVFVHCEMGDDRTGCMVAISRIAYDNYSFDEAYEEMLHFGFSKHFDALTDAVRTFAEEKTRVTNK